MANNLSLVLFLSKEKNSSISKEKVINSEHPSRITGANKLQDGA